jgi:hypothetical protein
VKNVAKQVNMPKDFFDWITKKLIGKSSK